MPDFDYIAKGLDGKQVAGTLTAGSEKDALTALQGQSLFPVKIGLSEQASSLIIGREVEISG